MKNITFLITTIDGDELECTTTQDKASEVLKNWLKEEICILDDGVFYFNKSFHKKIEFREE